MAKTRHVANASTLIDDYFRSLPQWSQRICNKLRGILNSADPEMTEDWKWGPNFYCEGMVCGIAGFKNHVNFVFFRGSLLKDKYKLFEPGTGTVTRYIKIKDVKEIDQNKILEYVFKAIDNNRQGKKIVKKKEDLKIPTDVKKELKSYGLTKIFEMRTYSRKKELINWIENAKRTETRVNRIEKMIDHLKKKM